MAPFLAMKRAVNDASFDQQILSQWTDPGDILSILLLVGGDVIQRAIAQQAGDRFFPTPVVFSFGWVAYAFIGLLSAVGDNLLMPTSPDIPSIVISTEKGYARTNQSWILGRILRDFELSWWNKEENKAAQKDLTELRKKKGREKVSLCLSVYEPTVGAQPKVLKRDLVWCSGYGVIVLQLGLACVAWGRWGDWEIFAITVGGTLLALVTASLPQWRRERWECRDKTEKSFVICRGNGCQHALLVIGNGEGMDLEDLASTGEGVTATETTRYIMTSLAVLWIALLITVSGIKQRTWILIGIGALGMIHTVFVAGKARSPSAFGIHLTYRGHFLGKGVMATLQSAEESYPGVGRSMLPVFFPGDLSPKETQWWDEKKRTEKQRLEEKAEERRNAKAEKETPKQN